MSIGARRSRLLEDPSGLRSSMSMNLQHLECIRKLIPADGTLLEYGSGFSTTWLRQQSREDCTIISVEHDARYAELADALLSPYAPAGVRGEPSEALQEGWEDYVYAPFRQGVVPAGTKFDIIVIDGVIRNACMVAVPELLAPEGWVALHDAERDYYSNQNLFKWIALAIPATDEQGRQLRLGKLL